MFCTRIVVINKHWRISIEPYIDIKVVTEYTPFPNQFHLLKQNIWQLQFSTNKPAPSQVKWVIFTILKLT